jgi:hypothetical protein
MLSRFLFGSILVGVAAAVVSSMPDIARYLKMREM